MEERSSQKKINKTLRNWFVLIGIIFIIIAGTLIGLFFMWGNTTVIENRSDNETVETLTCHSMNIKYPIFTYDNSKNRDLKIDATFNDEQLSTISLIYQLFYDSKNEIVASETNNHAAMDISFGKSGLSANSFNANYSLLDNALQMNLYAKAGDIDESSAKYFLLDNFTSDKYARDGIKDFYESMGFQCEIRN